MMIKKGLTWLTVAVAAITLAACGNNASSAKDSSSKATTSAKQTSKKDTAKRKANSKSVASAKAIASSKAAASSQAAASAKALANSKAAASSSAAMASAKTAASASATAASAAASSRAAAVKPVTTTDAIAIYNAHANDFRGGQMDHANAKEQQEADGDANSVVIYMPGPLDGNGERPVDLYGGPVQKGNNLEIDLFATSGGARLNLTLTPLPNNQVRVQSVTGGSYQPTSQWERKTFTYTR
ncbi:hypothetical protein [Lacticaseibacillus sp. GG6-2]